MEKQFDVTVDRAKYIGGSDIPIIMNLSPFKKRFELLLEKAEIKLSEFEGNAYTEYGNLMEQKIIDYINDCDFYEDEGGFHEDQIIKGNRRYNADGVNTARVLEVKTTSQIKQTVDEYDIYLSQLLDGMEMFEKQYGTLAVYERPEDFIEQMKSGNLKFDPERLQLFDIEMKNYDLFVERKNKAVDLFVEDLEKIIENPLLTEEDLKPKEIVELAGKIIENEVKFKEIDETQKNDKTKLKSLMEAYGEKGWTTDADVKIALVEDGKNKIVEITEIDEEAFANENAELIAEYEEVLKRYNEAREEYSTVRKEVQKGKAGYIKITMPKVKE
jgi:hypothetical protein